VDGTPPSAAPSYQPSWQHDQYLSIGLVVLDDPRTVESKDIVAAWLIAVNPSRKLVLQTSGFQILLQNSKFFGRRDVQRASEGSVDTSSCTGSYAV
jgi:hypothetical protein